MRTCPILAFVAGVGAAWSHPRLSFADVRVPDNLEVKDYNRVGIQINRALKHLAAGFVGVDRDEMALAFHPDFAATIRPTWKRRAEAPQGGVSTWIWEPAMEENPRGLEGMLDTFERWAGGFSTIESAVFKLHELEQLRADRSADASVRFEMIGRSSTGKRLVERGYFDGEWRMSSVGTELTGLRLREGRTVTGSGNAFADRAAERGIEFHGDEDPRFVPPSDALRFQIVRHALGGASAGDVDGDGYDDILMGSGGPLRLFQNEGTSNPGYFRDRTIQSGLDGILQANATLLADFDNDGDADLYVAHFYGHNQMLENDGFGHFSDVTKGSGLQADDATAALAAADFNGDGLLDLYLGRFLDAKVRVPSMIHYARNGEPNRLYLGEGGLRFRDVSARSGADDVGLTLGIAVADYDRDGDQDIYLANDFGRNALLRNDGSAQFEDVAKEAGAMAISGGMSASFGDYDDDGQLDLYVSSVRSNQRWFSQDINLRGYVLRIVESQRRAELQQLFVDLNQHLGDRWDQLGQVALGGNYLLRNRGDGTFEDVSDETHARPAGWYWSSGFFDADNDGDLDIFAVNGWITGKNLHDL